MACGALQEVNTAIHGIDAGLQLDLRAMSCVLVAHSRLPATQRRKIDS